MAVQCESTALGAVLGSAPQSRPNTGHAFQPSPLMSTACSGSLGRSTLDASERLRSPRSPFRSARRPLDPLRVPEAVGLVLPSWLPYVSDAAASPLSCTGSMNAISSSIASPKSSSSRSCTKGVAGSPRGPSCRKDASKKRATAWSDRHHVSDSKDNCRLPRFQRQYFDDLPITRCQGGAYHAVPGHRARNFDHFCLAPTPEQYQDLLRRFERYPFLAKRNAGDDGSTDSAVLAAAPPADVLPTNAQAPDAGQKDEPEAEPHVELSATMATSTFVKSVNKVVAVNLFWGRHLRAEKKDYGLGCEARSSISTVSPNRALLLRRSGSLRGPAQQFHKWCAAKFGSYVKLWQCLDTHNNMRVGQGQFLRGLQELGYSGDTRELFKVINKDQTGTLLFYHFAPEAALGVAKLLQWARSGHGGFKGLGISSSVDQNSRMNRAQFYAAFKKKGFMDEDSLAYAFELIDRDGHGTVSRAEASILDTWEYPEWLVADPDEDAAVYYKERLLEKALGNTLLAWRYLDKNGSMRVSWHDFRTSCRKLFPAEDCSDLAAAWRALDDDLSGWLSLREFDSTAYDGLARFCQWIHDTFGSVMQAFPKLGSSKPDSKMECAKLTLSEFRHVCKPSGLGDRILSDIFHGLDADNGGFITSHEVRFLDTWKFDAESKDEDMWGKATPSFSVKPRASMEDASRYLGGCLGLASESLANRPHSSGSSH